MGPPAADQLTPDALSDSALMALFDRAEGLLPAARRLALAEGLLPGGVAVEGVGLGDAERLFWRTKCSRFGPRAPAQFPCDACGEIVGFAVPDGFDLPPQASSFAQVEHGGQSYHIDCPTLGDFGADLAGLCPDGPWQDPDFRARAAEALDAADPAIDVIFDVACPECGTDNPRAFDAAAFLWADLEAFATGVFAQVAILGRAFGWTEAETLSLSPARRARYVDMVA